MRLKFLAVNEPGNEIYTADRTEATGNRRGGHSRKEGVFLPILGVTCVY
jgi:hypothetical protein